MAEAARHMESAEQIEDAAANQERPIRQRRRGGGGSRLPPDAPVRTDYRRAIIAGVVAFGLLFGGGGLWMAMAHIAGAVIARGTVVVRGKPKSIQHPDGGVLRAIHVKTGETVHAGQLLVELDDTLLRANLEIYRNRMLELLSRRARLQAERDGRDLSEKPPAMVRLFGLQGYEKFLEGQKKILQASRQARAGMKAQMREKVVQLQKQIDGLLGLRKARREQLAIINKELSNLASLRRKGLVAAPRVLSLERQRSGILGELADIEAQLARTRDAIEETKLAAIQIDRDFLEKVVTELHQVDLKIQDLSQQIHATEKKLARTRVRAPVTGVVHELRVHTIGGVIRPGEVIMQIIPLKDGTDFEVNVSPRFIDRVHPGQKVRVRFPSFNARTTPELWGRVTLVSPSSVVDPKTGTAFYRVGVQVPPDELRRLGNKRLVPGMPVEAFIQTHERTALSYFIKPLTDNFSRAFRED